MSSERIRRRRIPATIKRNWPPNPSPPPHRRTPPKSKPSRPIDVLHKSCSEPLLPINDLVVGDDQSSLELEGGWLYRPQTCGDVFSHQSFSPESPKRLYEGYQKDAKVVVNVTVEGSPGPIRTMVKLGSSVEDMIKLVIAKYGEEGRSPRLPKNAASYLDLHLSYFSLQSLDRSNVIGQVGSRNFYLRKSGWKSVEDSPDTDASTSFTSETIYINENSTQPIAAAVSLPAYITRKITKIVRKICKLWRIFGCIHCV
ncbi:hypothetical protein Nepgr_028468 [Nepenthes gracilis]|uniref:DUF7054 domain-containing protein n=1 Tax=Nepenthes gracilis TaxID=150966 RepID=A0AAD3Y3Z7_NEPGR|nr:hypothetical protein Nepgr_028468 [Nepenthes gracilis]